MALESMLTFAAQELVKKLTTIVAQEIGLAWGFKSELKTLDKTLATIVQDYLGDADHQPFTDQCKALEGWIKKLKVIAHEADDVLDDFKYELFRRKVEINNHMRKKVLNFFSLSSNPVAFRLKMAHRIQRINAALIVLKSEAPAVALVANAKRDASPPGIPWNRQTNSRIAVNEIVVGREEVVSEIVTTLTSSKTNQANLAVMAIMGLPGLGKTTLAKTVYNEESIGKYFERKIWVCVSNNFDVNLILLRMLESLNPAKAPAKDNQDALLNFLQEELKDKRYLLVLDDVWNEHAGKWKNLMDCLLTLDSAKESKIILTTRNDGVASISATLFPPCKLEELSVDDCWSILKDAAFPNSSTPLSDGLQEIGKKIAQRCAGVPLAAKVLGGILKSEYNIAKWISVNESTIWSSPEGEGGIMPVLKLSFDYLTPSLKQCFAYCSMFIQDMEIEKDNLIQLWMAQGLLHPSRKNEEMEDIGNEYFDILLQSSLFQVATRNEDGTVSKCKMHDLVHNLAEHVSRSESITGERIRELDDTLSVQHVARVPNNVLDRIREGGVGRLRSLFASDELPTCMLPGYQGLRVLNLYESKIMELPTSIGKLKHLRYLNISRTSITKLPASIGKLYNLQTLRATNCDGLEKFPKEVLNLINLRHVYFGRNTKFPLGMGQLTQLRTIPHFYVDQGMGRKIEELGALKLLMGELIIYNLEHVRDADEAKKAKLEEKKNVKHLKLVWSTGISTTNNNEKDLAEGLHPNSALESLKIVGFMGAKLPSWLMSRTLPLNNLTKIQLSECHGCEEVSSLGHLRNLKTLWIDSMANLKCLGEEFYGYDLVRGAAKTSGGTRALFPALKGLLIRNCRELFQLVELAPTSSESVEVFPCLKQLSIFNCPKLRNVASQFPSLKRLRIENNQELTCLPEGIFLNNNNNLMSVCIHSCHKLTSIAPNVSGCCASLRELKVWNCKELRHLPDGLDTLPLLNMLSIQKCPSLQLIPIRQVMVSLRTLNIHRCDGLSGILSGLEYCASLQKLSISGCRNLTSIEIGVPLTSLKRLDISFCPELSSIPPLKHFPSLQYLFISCCPKLESLDRQLRVLRCCR